MNIIKAKCLAIPLFIFFLCSLLLPLSIQASPRGIAVIGDLNHQSGKLGAYRALIIGINDYKDPKIPDLKTAVNDAKAMAELLRNRYGFQVKLLLGRKATKETIYRALRNMVSSTKPTDSVLIYYAGHGDLDRIYDDGWWIPADAKGGDPLTYLDNTQVQKSMRSMKARHVLLISDSCYSGILFGQARAMPQVIDDKYYLNLYNEKSRWGMTSGNKTPVSDQGTGSHSVFAYQLLKELSQNEKPYISTQEIYTRIAPIVGNNSDQTPLCRPIRNTGDQGGEFVFVASSGTVVDIPASKQTETSLSVKSNVQGARVLLDGKFVGRTELSDLKVTPGEQSIRVEKDGYDPYTKRVLFKKGRSKSLTAYLNTKAPPKASLSFETRPDNALIKILNIKPRFYQGMDLDAGRYHIEVSADGYKTHDEWITLSAGEDRDFDIRLTKKRTASYTSSYSSGTAGNEITRDGWQVVYQEDFDSYISVPLPNPPWEQISWGNGKISDVAISGKSLRLIGPHNNIFHTFPAITHFRLEYYLFANSTNEQGIFVRTGGTAPGHDLIIGFRGGQVSLLSGLTGWGYNLMPYENGKWYHFIRELDCLTNEGFFYVEDVLNPENNATYKSGCDPAYPLTDINNVHLITSGTYWANCYIDELKIAEP